MKWIVRDKPYVLGCMERWARWCIDAGGGSISSTGKIMAEIKSNVCPLWIEDVQNQRAHDPHCSICKGTGRVKLKLETVARSRPIACPICEGKLAEHKSYTEFAGKECFRCRGLGFIVVHACAVHPASIRCTTHDGGKGVADLTAHLIDQTWRGWRDSNDTLWCHRVVSREYFWTGTQEMKAEGNPRRGIPRISTSFYRRTLTESLSRIESVLDHELREHVARAS